MILNIRGRTGILKIREATGLTSIEMHRRQAMEEMKGVAMQVIM
jgi:hypothetical protein